MIFISISFCLFSLAFSLPLHHTHVKTQKHLSWPQVLKLVKRCCANNMWLDWIHCAAFMLQLSLEFSFNFLLFVSVEFDVLGQAFRGVKQSDLKIIHACPPSQRMPTSIVSTSNSIEFYHELWAVHKRRKEKVHAKTKYYYHWTTPKQWMISEIMQSITFKQN